MEEKDKNWELNDYSPLFIKDIKDILQDLYNQFRALSVKYDYVLEENNRLKSESYKDEELSKMKKKLDEMSSEYYRGFPITEKENKKIAEWMDKITEGEPEMKITAIGGRFTYVFTPTSIGTIGVIKDSVTRKELQFRELC